MQLIKILYADIQSVKIYAVKVLSLFVQMYYELTPAVKSVQLNLGDFSYAA